MSIRIRRPARSSLIAFAWTLIGIAPAHSQDLPVRASFAGAETSWLAPSTPIEIVLSRAPIPSEGRIAVFVGDTDWSALTERIDTTVTVRPVAALISSGDQPVVVFVVSPQNTWSEVGRFGIRVLTPRGFESATVRPAMEFSNKGQLAYERSPALPPTPRDRYQDFNFTAGLQAQTVRSGWTTETQVNVLGTSLLTERLRFGTEGNAAPAVDLAGYAVGTSSRRTRLTVGHVALGGQRYLGQQYPTRGVEAVFRFGPVVDLSVAAANGTTMVGWSNPLGVNNRDHQLRTATVGFELRPSRPGAARLSATLIHGSLLPIAGFTQGVVNDAERSQSAGLQFTARDPQQRVHVDAGFARSHFDNPNDPLLARGLSLVPVRATTTDARYTDVSVDLIRNARLGASQQARVTATYRYEQVDPLFRSVGAPVRPDVLQQVTEVTSQVGPVAAQVSYTWLHDNLAQLQSVLTTRSRMVAMNIAATPASLWPALGPRAQWIPLATYSFNRTHQFADGLPVNAGFDSLSQVPDQANIVHAIGVEWQQPRWRTGYRLNHSLQDNRQPGRELADFLALTHSISIGATPHARGDVGIDLGFEGANNQEFGRSDVTRRVSLFGNWRPARRTTVAGMTTRSISRGPTATDERTTTDFSLQLSQNVLLTRRGRQAPSALFFIRVARQSLFAFQPLFPTVNRNSTWSVTSGFTMRAF